MVGIELVKDKKSKEPHKSMKENLIRKCYNDKLLLLGAGKSTIRLAPPLIITKEEADKGIDILEKDIKELEK